MKLKQWLREYQKITYAEYKVLSDSEKDVLLYEHQKFCRIQQIREHQNWRPMTDEEREETTITLEKEKQRYEVNLKIGGIDGRGNYTALHHRW